MNSSTTSTARHFGRHVGSLIEAGGLSLQAASTETGIPLTTLRRHLRSESMTFTIGELTRIAGLLNTTASAAVTEYEAGADTIGSSTAVQER